VFCLTRSINAHCEDNGPGAHRHGRVDRFSAENDSGRFKTRGAGFFGVGGAHNEQAQENEDTVGHFMFLPAGPPVILVVVRRQGEHEDEDRGQRNDEQARDSRQHDRASAHVQHLRFHLSVALPWGLSGECRGERTEPGGHVLQGEMQGAKRLDLLKDLGLGDLAGHN
jgi:hypothetical protein